MREIFRSVAANWQIVVLGMLLVAMTTVSFYMITVYTPTFGSSVLHLTCPRQPARHLLRWRFQPFWLPVMGALSDRIGRRPVLLVFSALTLLTAYPVLAWLVGECDLRHCSSCCCGCRSFMAATTARWWWL